MSSEIIQKEFLTFKVKGSYFEYDSLHKAVHSMTAFYIDDKINTIDELIAEIHNKIIVYKNNLKEVPWGDVKFLPEPKQPLCSCACFGCRLSRRVSGWFGRSKCK